MRKGSTIVHIAQVKVCLVFAEDNVGIIGVIIWAVRFGFGKDSSDFGVAYINQFVRDNPYPVIGWTDISYGLLLIVDEMGSRVVIKHVYSGVFDSRIVVLEQVVVIDIADLGICSYFLDLRFFLT